MTCITKKFKEHKIIAMIKNMQLNDSVKLGEALVAGGIRIVNISQHSQDEVKILEYYSKNMPQLISGGGNVQTVEEALNAINAGAKFIFSPLFDLEMVTVCKEHDTPIFPVLTDPFKAIDLGLKTIALYPVEKLGGARFAQSLFDRFGITSIVAGGITKDTISSYLKTPSIIATTGSWMIDPEKVKEGDFDSIVTDCQNLLKDIL